jgi:hypothetical protein
LGFQFEVNEAVAVPTDICDVIVTLVAAKKSPKTRMRNVACGSPS